MRDCKHISYIEALYKLNKPVDFYLDRDYLIDIFVKKGRDVSLEECLTSEQANWFAGMESAIQSFNRLSEERYKDSQELAVLFKKKLDAEWVKISSDFEKIMPELLIEASEQASKIYKKAISEIISYDTNVISDSIKQLESLNPEYLDTKDQIHKAKKKIVSIEKKKKRKTAILIAIPIILVVLYFAVPNVIYPLIHIYLGNQSLENGEYEEAINEYKIADNSMGESHIEKAEQEMLDEKYTKAQTLIDNQSYLEAIELLSEIEEDDKAEDLLNESYYLLGVQSFESENYEQAYNCFDKSRDYKDSSEYLSQISGFPIHIHFEVNNQGRDYNFEYDASGKMVKAWSEATDGTQLREYIFDESGRIIKENKTDDTNTACDYIYDQNKIRKIYGESSGFNRTYDEHGVLLKEDGTYKVPPDEYHNPADKEHVNEYKDDLLLKAVILYPKSTSTTQESYFTYKYAKKSDEINSEVIWTNVRLIAGWAIWQ